MTPSLREIIKRQGIPLAAGIPFSACTVTRPHLLNRFGFAPKSVYIGLIPYLTEDYYYAPRKTVSAYASGYDYHLFIDKTGEAILKEAKDAFPGSSFYVCGDKSPIDERRAAACAGLGVLGENGLLITKDYSSYVFIFEVFSDAEPDSEPVPAASCPGCGRCRLACPALKENSECLSSLTQRKLPPDENERRIISECGTVWGCDVCQEVCPFTEEAVRAGTIFTSIDFFRENIRPAPEIVDILDDGDFQKRAYSWRGRKVILRNLEIISGGKKEEVKK